MLAAHYLFTSARRAECLGSVFSAVVRFTSLDREWVRLIAVAVRQVNRYKFENIVNEIDSHKKTDRYA